MSKFVDLQENRESSGRPVDSDSSSGHDDKTLSTDVDDLLESIDKGNVSKTYMKCYIIHCSFVIVIIVALLCPVVGML